MGTYDGDGNAPVSVEEIALAELPPEFVRERVERATVEQFRRLLDPEAVRKIFGPHEMGETLRDIDQSTLPARISDLVQRCYGDVSLR